MDWHNPNRIFSSIVMMNTTKKMQITDIKIEELKRTNMALSCQDISDVLRWKKANRHQWNRCNNNKPNMIQGTSPLFSCYTVPHMCHYQHQKVSQDPVGTCQDWLSGLICLHQHQEWCPWLTSELNRKNMKKFKTKWNNMNVRIHIHF